MTAFRVFKQAVSSALFGAVLVGSAHAGLVTGTADPVFGTPFTSPSLSYGARFSVDLADGLRAQGTVAGTKRTVDLPAAFSPDEVRLKGEVYLFPTGSPFPAWTSTTPLPAGYSHGTFNFLLKSVTFDTATGALIDWALNCPSLGPASPCSQDMTGLSSAAAPFGTGTGIGGTNFFYFDWAALSMPIKLTCFDVPPLASDSNPDPRACSGIEGPGSSGQPGGLDVVYVDKFDDGRARATGQYGFVATGQPLRLSLSGPNSVPEPGALLLLVTAGLAAGWARRRRA